MEDIRMAIEMAQTSNGPSSELLSNNLTDSSKSLCNQFKQISLCWCPVTINRVYNVALTTNIRILMENLAEIPAPKGLFDS